uniref:ANK_REP_REGION domain-containing protein n=1 Tax=Bursaphelenchus xylophilus TaxID=6326 RepID=A0A1I7RZV0_BURXY
MTHMNSVSGSSKPVGRSRYSLNAPRSLGGSGALNSTNSVIPPARSRSPNLPRSPMGRAAVVAGNHRPMSRSRNIYGPAVHIKTHDMLTPQERRFLESAESGDRPTLIACLNQKNAAPLNVNCVDAMGRTAIEIAVDNENFEIVELLLRQTDIRIGNALLCAIREGVYRIVEMLVNHPSINKDMLGDGWHKYLSRSEVATSEYSSDISPIMLAAHLNRFEILQMLLRKEATIERPHKHSCRCEVCTEDRGQDSLHHSLKRINTYRALASPAWMSLTSSDPILSAFRLSWELQNLARLENEFKDIYLQLSEQCKQFACDLLSQCRSTDEVIALLNKEDNAADENINVKASKISLLRLKMAIKYEQKMFVSHPHCQQLLTSIWSQGIPFIHHRDSKWNFLIYAVLILLWPVLSFCYIIMPKSRFGSYVRSPFMKFLYYSTSFGCFLLLLTLVTLEAYHSEKGDLMSREAFHSRASDRGAPPTFVEVMVMFWVLGMLWSEIKQLWDEGLAKYVFQWWNWLDFCMMCLYLCTIAIRLSGYLIYVAWNDGSTPRYVIRTYWNAYEPMLVAEALFAVGNVLSFARIIYLFQISPYLGPLQISLGCMLVDVAKFCFIFVLIISSFAIGLAQLYWYYEDNTPVCVTPESCTAVSNVFSSIGNSYMTLLWSLFAITKVEDTDVAEEHTFTQWIGRGMFMMYHITSIIVLLNMLIAMMSHSFQTINDHADLEWKFHRTKLWMAHFDEGSSLPPPFNIIITPKAIYYGFCKVVNTIKWLTGSYHFQKTRNRATIRRPGYSRKSKELEHKTPDPEAPEDDKPLTYMDIIERLVSRFIHQTKKNMKMDGVNEDDLLEIKQDISSLRYELRDDRRKEIVRSSSHIDAVKRDIMRTMSTSTKIWRSSQKRRNHSVTEEGEMESDFNDSDTELKSTTSIAANTLSPTVSISYDRPKQRSYSDALTCPMTSVDPPSPSYSEQQAVFKRKTLSAQKSAPSPLKIIQTPPEEAPLLPSASSLEAIHQLRELMNHKLDQLIAQVTSTSADEPSILRGGEGLLPAPLSAPARSSLSPSRVNFALNPDPE